MTRPLVSVMALFALACSQDAAPPAPPALDEPTAMEQALPDRTATEAADAEATMKAGEDADGPTFEGDHAMAQAQAYEASLAWLALVDAGDYAGGWSAGASVLQDTVPKEQFGTTLGAHRGSFGAVQSRRFAKAEYTTVLPGAADGEYVVIEYHTAFEQKAEAVETITPMLDWDGTWKVSGYYVR